MAALSRKLRSVEGGRLMFWCPGCDGAHQVGVGEGPGPRWGDGAPPAICHSFVTDGRIQFLSDCTHPLAGQTVDIPEWDAG